MKIVKGWVLEATKGGTGTFNVTIPNKEATAIGIKKADVVFVTQEGRNIKVATTGSGKGRSVMKCGNSLAITIPKDIWDALKLEHGDCFIVESNGEELIYKKVEG